MTVGDGLALYRAKTLYDTIGVTSTDLGLQLQAERAITAKLLSSGHTNSAELSTQQKKTTESLDKFMGMARDEGTRDSLSGELQTNIDTVLGSFERLSFVREAVATGRFNRLQAIDGYNGLMDQLFGLYERLVSVPDLTIFQQAGALQGMGNAYEMIAREDALIRGALISRRLTQEEQNTFSEWVSTRRFLYRKNRSVLSGEMRAPYERVLGSPMFARFSDLENLVVNQVHSGGPLPAEAGRWEATVQSITSELDTARARATDALNAESASTATGILARIVIAGGLGLVAIAFTIIFSVRFGRRLAHDLADLRDVALDLADVRLPRVVAKLRQGEDVDVAAEAPPIRAGGSLEVEDVAHAFTSVQRTAVEAAVGQANLRKGVSQVFLNLARRNQGLLHRQLTLLDTMQRRTDDPESLRELFRLDHLTTRMRRHAESLIILSGSTPGRSWRKPVPVIDVVRAAISEVEDYTRISMTPMPEASLTGASVADIVHLIAELMENAAIFSPPQTKVQVRGEVVANGLVLEVEDRGLGLEPEKYDEINMRLADPPEFDPADSDRLGLFVVSQLAGRYGINVFLRSSPYGGTTAIVLIPRALVADDGAPPAITGSAEQAPYAQGSYAQAPYAQVPAPHVTAPALAAGSHAKPGPAAMHRSESNRDESHQGESGNELAESDDPDSSPFFTPAALRTEAVPSALRVDLAEPGSPGPCLGSSGPGSPSENGANGTEVHRDPRTDPGLADSGLADSVPTDSRPTDSGLHVSEQAAVRHNKPEQKGLDQDSLRQDGLTGNGSRPVRGSIANGTHAGLPRRVRQASIAPQLRDQPPLSAPIPDTDCDSRSPEEARAMLSAIQRGAQRGREESEQPGSGTPDDHAQNMHGEKGDE
ncbi:nitrate- and nitrite sensing domain-containing protein [Sphaerimonospora cavernae]|uniref:histidine kinase n=1 Tax=Sphaerimonospora cavernae TaxID=1740611 RepID=A0ABV6UAD0_9ACTN